MFLLDMSKINENLYEPGRDPKKEGDIRDLKAVLEEKKFADFFREREACERGEHGPRKVLMTSDQGAYEICPRCRRSYLRPLNSEEEESYLRLLETPMTI
jgi:hypothetical protein